MNFRRLSTTLALLATFGARAEAQTIIYDGSNPIAATTMTGFVTQFSQLAGMEVSWSFSGGGGGSGVWGNLGGGSYGVSGTNFSLSATGGAQTYFSLWSLHGVGLSGFSLNPTTANAIFDVSNPSPGSNGSSLGQSFDYCAGMFLGFCIGGGDNWNTTATYRNPVMVDGNPAVGDLWGTLDVAFGTTFGTQQICGSVRRPRDCSVYDVKYVQDADMALFVENPNGGPQEVVPEPATMTLLATGLAGMAAARRRRRKS